ncbi:GNAT family N-acetyltransferase [Synechococcus sp. GreenBA-s]|nr:GNAT family N-acetyltransferase [Synechococcus sp. GreenBA-s]
MVTLRRLQSRDHPRVLAIYREAVRGLAPGRYDPAQVQAWAGQAEADAPELRRCLDRGWGLVSCDDDGLPRAFAVLDPPDRLALLYCHPDFARQGRASALLEALEQQARRQGVATLRTEASVLSRPLFARRGWRVSWLEELRIGGIGFRRFRMALPLDPPLARPEEGADPEAGPEA